MSPSPQAPPADPGASPGESQRHKTQEDLAAIVGTKEDRKVRARADASKGVWFGFGMFGMIGWSVAVPALAMIALGVWIDSKWPSQYSWTLMLMFIGVVLGCVNGWYWISRERDKLER